MKHQRIDMRPEKVIHISTKEKEKRKKEAKKEKRKRKSTTTNFVNFFQDVTNSERCKFEIHENSSSLTVFMFVGLVLKYKI